MLLNTKKYDFLLIILIVSLSGIAQSSLDYNLEKAYTANSLKLYNLFLQKWQSDSAPIKSLDSLKTVEKDVYAIFTDFYNPFKLNRIGKGEWGDQLYYDLHYVIIQNIIYYNVFKTDSLNYDVYQINDDIIEKRGRISNFRPNITFTQAKILFLLPSYKDAISKFLGSENLPPGSGNIMSPAKTKGESTKKLQFLNQKLRIFLGHNGRRWYIETHPNISHIDFNKDKSLAKVYYRLVYQGGEATYKKINGKWKFINAKLTWIE